MKKKGLRKRKISVMYLAAILCVMMLAATVQAEENAPANVTAGEDVSGESKINDGTETLQNDTETITGTTETPPASEETGEETGETQPSEGENGGNNGGNAADLPAHLDYTSKVEKLELSKRDPVTLSEVSIPPLSFTPRTGDPSHAERWAVVMVAAVAAIVVTIIIMKRRK